MQGPGLAPPPAAVGGGALAAAYRQQGEEHARRKRRWLDEQPLLAAALESLAQTREVILGEQAAAQTELASLHAALAQHEKQAAAAATGSSGGGGRQEEDLALAAQLAECTSKVGVALGEVGGGHPAATRVGCWVVCALTHARPAHATPLPCLALPAPCSCPTWRTQSRRRAGCWCAAAAPRSGPCWRPRWWCCRLGGGGSARLAAWPPACPRLPLAVCLLDTRTVVLWTPERWC